MAGVMVGIVISLAPLLIGIIFFHTTIIYPAIFSVSMVLSSLCFSSLEVLLSSPATEAPSQIMMLSALIRFPLIFISGIFIPLENLPAWGRAVSSISPLTYSADLMRYSLYGLEFYPVFFSMLVLLGFSVIFFAVAVKLHRKNLIKAL